MTYLQAWKQSSQPQRHNSEYRCAVYDCGDRGYDGAHLEQEQQ